MSVKFRTGDLYLGNRYTVSALMSHSADPDSRYSEIGMFIVEDHEDGPNTVTSTNVFILTNEGAKSVSLDMLLRDGSLQGAAHRPLTHRDKRTFMHHMVSASKELEGSKRERIDILLAVYKELNPERTGYTKAELIGKILDSVGLINYQDGMLLSNFQSGGVLDAVYGKETPLFPRESQYDKLETCKLIAREESVMLVKEYMDYKPVMSIDNFRSYGRPHVNAAKTPPMQIVSSHTENGSKFQQNRYKEEHHGEQLPSLNKTKAGNKKKTMHSAQSNYSDSMAKRLARRDRQKKEHESTKPKTNSVFIAKE